MPLGNEKWVEELSDPNCYPLSRDLAITQYTDDNNPFNEKPFFKFSLHNALDQDRAEVELVYTLGKDFVGQFPLISIHNKIKGNIEVKVQI